MRLIPEIPAYRPSMSFYANLTLLFISSPQWSLCVPFCCLVRKVICQVCLSSPPTEVILIGLKPTCRWKFYHDGLQDYFCRCAVLRLEKFLPLSAYSTIHRVHMFNVSEILIVCLIKLKDYRSSFIMDTLTAMYAYTVILLNHLQILDQSS